MKIDNKKGRQYALLEVDREGLYFKEWDGVYSEDNLVVTEDKTQAKMYKVIDCGSENVGIRKDLNEIKKLRHKAKYCIVDLVPTIKDRWAR